MRSNVRNAPAVSLLSTGTALTGEHYYYSRSHGQLFRIFYCDSTGNHSCTAPSSPPVSLAPLRSLQVGSSSGTSVSQVPLLTIWAILCSAQVLGPLLRTA